MKGLILANPDFGTTDRVDMLIGPDVYCRTVLYGRWFGPLGSPMAIKTWFGWVLSGPTAGKSRPDQNVCCISVASCDEELRRFWEVEELHVSHQEQAAKVQCRWGPYKPMTPKHFCQDLPDNYFQDNHRMSS